MPFAWAASHGNRRWRRQPETDGDAGNGKKAGHRQPRRGRRKMRTPRVPCLIFGAEPGLPGGRHVYFH